MKALATRRETVLRSLDEEHEHRDSRIYRILEPFSNEALVYLHAVTEGAARDRIERFVQKLMHVEIEVSGDDLLGLGLKPSPAFSAILGQARDDRLDGKAVGREEELANLRRLVDRAHPDE